VVAGRRVTINGSVNQPVKRLRWSWNDGKSSETATFPGVHVYQNPGAYTVSVAAYPLTGKVVRRKLRVLVGTLWPGLLPGGDLLLVSPVVTGNKVLVYGAIAAPIRSVRWSWGDGKTTTSRHFPVRHTYVRPGTYAVRVVVETRAGKVLRAATRLRIGGPPPPVGKLVLAAPVVLGRTVTLAGTVKVPWEWVRWDWGDGTPIEKGAFPGRHVYKDPGVYTVTVRVRTKAGKTLQASTTVRIHALPPAGKVVLAAPVVLGRTATIAGTVLVPWKAIYWTWGDGTRERKGPFPGKHTYRRPGTFTIRVRVVTKAGKTLRAATTVRIY